MTEGKSMYSEKDFESAKRGMLLRFGVTAVIVLLTALGCGLCMHFRLRLANAAIAAVGSALAAMYFTLKALPWWRYFRLLQDMRMGRSHEYDVLFRSVSEETSLRDGVWMRSFVVELADAEDEDKERMFFWDDDKPLPDLKEGQKIHIRTFGSYITALEPMGQEG